MESFTTGILCLVITLLIFFDTQGLCTNISIFVDEFSVYLSRYFILCLFNTLYAVAAQEGPGIVITHPGQDVELLCNVTVNSTSQTAGWLVNNTGLYSISAIRNGILTGHTATLDSNNLIVKNITMNDGRNDSEYKCVIIPAQGMPTFANIIVESDPTVLYVAGEYIRIHTYLVIMI